MCIREKIISSVLVLVLFSPIFITDGYETDYYNDQSSLVDKDNYDHDLINKAEQLLTNGPRAFTANFGQLENDGVLFYDQSGRVWFTDDGVWFEVREEIPIGSRESRVEGRESDEWFDPMDIMEPPEPVKYKRVILKQEFVGANLVRPMGKERLSWNSNFFLGNDSEKWCTDVPNYREIYYENLYDSIDLRYYMNNKGLKYDLIVHPGGDPNDIRLRYEGAQDLCVDNSGNLRIKTLFGDITDSNLFIYQNIENDKKVIEGKFKIINSMTIGFDLFKKYDKSKDLIIDPLVYSTYIGGNENDYPRGIAIDLNKSAYISGQTPSSDFPNTTGVHDTILNGTVDMFVLKIDPTGSLLLYSTYIGGSNWDMGESIVIDSNCNTYLTGRTNSTDFPKSIGAYDPIHNGGYDVFVVKLNYNGSNLIYSTFVGGSRNDQGFGITIDSNCNAYVTGWTDSSDFPNSTNVIDPTHNGDFDVFVFKLDSTGASLIYSTYLGGSGIDHGSSIVLDSTGNVLITGSTDSPDFPNTTGAYDISHNGGYDVFVVKLNYKGSNLIYSTFVGGTDTDGSTSIAIDLNGNVYVVGITHSSDFPNTTGAHDNTFNGVRDVFVLKLNSLGTSLKYSTFIGGNNVDSSYGITIDSNDTVYIAGETQSIDFPNTTGAYDNTHNGKPDAFILILNPIGSSILYSTFFGGSNADGSGYIAIDFNNNIYVSGVTRSPDFPNTTGAYDTIHNGGVDIFVLKLNISLNDSFPSVLNLIISEPAILRTNPIYLYSNANDFEDLEKNLTPHFEYRDTNELVWNNTYFLKTQYNNSRWKAVFTPPKNAVLGLYDFRVRFNDTFGLCSRWLYMNDSLTVLNNKPWVDNLTLSNHSNLVGNNISLRINGTDVEEPEQNLTIELEYRDPNELSWEKSYLDKPRYINNRWESNFSIPFNTSFGYYDFRVRVYDSDGDYSQWLYANDSLLIYNDRPKVIDIELSNNSVYRTNSVFLYINSTDHETSESMLAFYVQYKPDDETDWTDLIGKYSNSNRRWETEFVTNRDTTLGLYDFRIRFEDNETTSTDWVYLNDSLKVLNNQPIISNELDDIPVGFSSVLINLLQYGSDIEDPAEELIWMVNETAVYRYLKSLSIIKNDTLKIVPLLNVTGYVNIDLILKDKDGGICTKPDITVHVESRITELTPKVTLLSPSNGSVVSTLTPKLEWSLDYFGDELITYSIYLDKTPAPEKIIKSNISMTSYTLETELEDRTTYYWLVIPILGICLSEPYCFIVNLSNKPDYKVNLTSEKDYVILRQGSETEINLTVRNEGILDDMYNIEYNSGTLQEYIFIDRILIQLLSNTESVLKLTIMIPENFGLGVHNISVAAKSLNGVTVSDEIAITVEVVKQDFIPKYGVSLAVIPASIEIEQGGISNVTLNIINFGNIADKYTVSFESDAFSLNNILVERNSISLNSSENKFFNVQIIVPDSTVIGTYNITFIIQSEQISNETNLTVHVKAKKVFSEPDDGGENMFIFTLTVIAFIILLIILIVFIILRKRIKRSRESAIPADMVSIEQDKSSPLKITPTVAKTSDKPRLNQPSDQSSIPTALSEAPVSVPLVSISTPVPAPKLESPSTQAPSSTPFNPPPTTKQMSPPTAQQPQLVPKQPPA
jgi:hypothetical protein